MVKEQLEARDTNGRSDSLLEENQRLQQIIRDVEEEGIFCFEFTSAEERV